MDVKATLETRQSKTGNPYEVIVIKLTDSYEKLVFLEKSEIELLKMSNLSKKVDMPDLPFFTDSEKSSLNN